MWLCQEEIELAHFVAMEQVGAWVSVEEVGGGDGKMGAIGPGARPQQAVCLAQLWSTVTPSGGNSLIQLKLP